jgi:hypothetical protein
MADESQAPPAEVPAAEAPPAESSVAEAPVEPVAVEVMAVVSKRYRLYNPFTKVYFNQNEQVDEAVLDGWLQSQLDAGYIVRV